MRCAHIWNAPSAHFPEFDALSRAATPVDSPALLDTIREVLDSPALPRIEVISARPEWVELVVPCTREAVERIQPVMAHLDAGLDPDVRESIAYAFRELLLNAVEWGGRLDPNRRVRIACLRSKRMLMYRIADPGSGFNIDDLPHAAIGHGSDTPIAHIQVREEKGLRPGGFGLRPSAPPWTNWCTTRNATKWCS